MRILIAVSLLLVACTKPNPNRCCTDEQDCTAQNLPNGSTCDEGLVCRGNQCIAQICESSANCDLAAPYCIVEPEGRCQETCTGDPECPGFGQPSDQQFCEAGACVMCRGNDDCSAATPVCDDGSCRGCAAHTDCASGACSEDGSCVEPISIAFVDPAGSATSNCERLMPCSLAKGLSLLDRPYVLLASGTYQSASTIDLAGTRWLIGTGTRPILTRSTPGPIVEVRVTAEITLEHLQFSGATGSLQAGTAGDGLNCAPLSGPASSTRTIHVIDDLFSQNTEAGIRARGCSTTITRTEFSANRDGAIFTDSTVSIDRSEFTRNQDRALSLDNGRFIVTNSFVTRNGRGIDIYASEPSLIEANTIVDNTARGLACNVVPPGAAYPNNIISRNNPNTDGDNCTYPSSIVLTDISPLKFASPDVAPFDYHLTAGSLAIDQATISTLDHDVDGDARPQGAGRDVGADELQ